jgi:hypothetical protein
MKRTNPRKLTDASKKQCTLTDFFLSRPTLPVNETRSDSEESEGEKPADPSAICSVEDNDQRNIYYSVQDDNDKPKIEDSVSKFPQSGKRKFQQSWLELLPQLRYEEGTAKCAVSFPTLQTRIRKLCLDFQDHLNQKLLKNMKNPIRTSSVRRLEVQRRILNVLL